jgi:flagellar motor switch protein FliG
VPVDRLNQFLVEQNPRLKSVVSYYLPTDARRAYLGGLKPDAKLELLQSAAQIPEVPLTEIQQLNVAVQTQLKGNQKSAVVSLAENVARLVETFSPTEEVTLLANCDGPAFDRYKRSTFTLGYLHEWTDQALAPVLEICNADEVTEYLRLKPELKDRVLALCPPLTATMVTDELARTDSRSETAKNETLASLKAKVVELLASQTISLANAIPRSDESETARAA